MPRLPLGGGNFFSIDQLRSHQCLGLKIALNYFRESAV